MRLYSEYDKCTGCYACTNICPQNCIELVLNDEGFRYPIIDENKCIDCGKCAEVCPIDKDIARSGILEPPKAYACYDLDDEVRLGSSSGGIGFTLASSIIDEGGVVFGASGSVIGGVYHTKVEDIEHAEKIRKSKYLQSDIGLTYREAKQDLEQGRKVLFTGTPCQIAGLNSYLGKEYANLYTADLICHGVPSEMVFHKHIEETEHQNQCEIVDYYRDKSAGCFPTHVTYVFKNGTKQTKSCANILYNRGFTTNLFIRKSCYTCKYATIPRIADISLGDYFGGNKHKEYDKKNQGLSLVTVNTEKGQTLFEDIEKQLFLKEFEIETVISESEHLAHPPRYNEYRELLFDRIKKKTYHKASKALLPPSTALFWFRVKRKILLEIFKAKTRLKYK